MAVVHNGNYNSYLYVNYSWGKDVNARTWSFWSEMGIHIASGWTFGSWGSYGSNDGLLRKNGMPKLSGGDHQLATYSTSGNYNDYGTAPSLTLTWAFNVNSSWGGYVYPHGSLGTVTGDAIESLMLWNDINPWNPDQTVQNGLMFNLTTSDGSSWTDLTGEPPAADFTKKKGTTATISNIRSRITGAHYSGNSVTGDASSTITWTFQTANYAVQMYTAWDTYSITYAPNGGSTTPTAQTKTYGVDLTLANSITRANGTQNGYTVTFNANTGTVSPTSKTATDTVSYSFANWKDNQGTTYSGGGTYTKNQANTLTAQWSSSIASRGSIATPTATKANGTATRTVTFDATTNGGTCSTSSLNSTATITYTGNGWYTATSGGTQRTTNGGTYTPSASETVYQQWSSSTGTYSAVTLPAATKANSTSTRTVTFNANQGTTTKASQNSTATVTYSQTGWWTAASGGTNRGNSGATYTPSASEKIYAQFSSSTGSYSAVTLPTAAECTRNGYILLGWATSDTATTATYAPGASYTPSATIILYAVWELDQATVWYKKVLPIEYQAVEYIEGTGTQYINTGYLVNNKTRVVIDVKANNTGTWLYGSRSGQGSTNTFGLYTNGSNEFWAQIGGNGNNNGGTFSGTVADRNVIDISGSEIILNGMSKKTYTNTLTTGSASFFLFGLNHAGAIDGRNLNGRIYSCEIYEDKDLIRYFVPCFRKNDNVIGLYDVINNVFYTNAGTGTFNKGNNINGYWIKGKVWVKSSIPSAYQEVEYIETDGGEVIDLGIIGTDTISVYDIQFKTASHRQLMGYGGNGSEYWGAASGTKFERGGTGSDETADTTQRFTITWSYNSTNNISTLNYKNANYDHNIVDGNATINVNSRHYYLFNIYNNTSSYACSCKLYHLEISKTGEGPVRNLVPCYRKSDNVIGLYDTVGNEFYTNIISGSAFTKGGNVNNSHWVKAKKFYTKQSGSWIENKTTA